MSHAKKQPVSKKSNIKRPVNKKRAPSSEDILSDNSRSEEFDKYDNNERITEYDQVDVESSGSESESESESESGSGSEFESESKSE